MSSASLEDVRTTTGMAFVRGSARMRLSTSNPLSLGSLRSSMTTAGICAGSRPAERAPQERRPPRAPPGGGGRREEKKNVFSSAPGGGKKIFVREIGLAQRAQRKF